MTDPVKGISGIQETSAGGNYSGGQCAEHHKKGASETQDDLIEISQDARDRSKGRKKKGLLEYLGELLE
jgi:hypothetical protein